MDLNIPFTKELSFKSNIAEISSISLEEDVTLNDHELLGDFIISGEFKNLDVNVDTNPFNFVIPFKVDLDDNVDISTIKYNIADFSYDIIKEDTLKVNILLHVDADEINNIFEEVPDDVLSERVFIDDNTTKEIEEDIDNKEIVSDNRDNYNKTDLLDNDYITYHVHEVKEVETLDSIASVYKISKEEIMKLNDITSVSINDKILIPFTNNEE